MTKSTSGTVAGDPIPPRAFNTEDAARYVGMSPSWLRKARIGITGPGPRFIKAGRKVLYSKVSLDSWLNG